MQEDAAAREALAAYDLRDADIAPLGTGLINQTYQVVTSAGERYVLQCLNPVFNPDINEDIDALTRHLASRGAITQRLVPVRHGAGNLWVTVAGRNWRLATYVPGVCFDRLETAAQAGYAGALLGQFHRNVSDLNLQLHTERLGVHDTARHLAELERALTECSAHRYYDAIAPLGEQVLTAASHLTPLPALPDRLVHGDPKISNLVFSAETGVGVCMIDLDTLAHMPVPLELGDAIRSWCNPRGEDETVAQFRLDYFDAAIKGYAAAVDGLLQPEEWQSFVAAASTIMVELAARFTTDALRESYFGWNANAFPDRSTHNQVRAAGQLSLQRSFAEHAAAADAAVAQAFSCSTDPTQ